jgi:hypothetical protein
VKSSAIIPRQPEVPNLIAGAAMVDSEKHCILARKCDEWGELRRSASQE